MQVLGYESLLFNDYNSPTKMECFPFYLVVVQTSDLSGWMEFEVALFERHRSFLWRERCKKLVSPMSVLGSSMCMCFV